MTNCFRNKLFQPKTLKVIILKVEGNATSDSNFQNKLKYLNNIEYSVTIRDPVVMMLLSFK